MDFDYDLPGEFIAQAPVTPRDQSRLMVIDRASGVVKVHSRFHELGRFLKPGDLLVLNQTRVIPARLYARKIPTGGRVEVLLLHRVAPQTWACLVGGKGLTPGKRLLLENDLSAEVIEDLGGPQRIMRFEESLTPILGDIGQMPLPPYIHEKLVDPERYQTVYAREPGSAAAPTAGLHFTPRLLEQLQYQGVNLAYVTLHVGLDTFAPVTEADPQEHAIHTEWCRVPAETAEIINSTRQQGGRIIAVGTTSVRTLETVGSMIHEPGTHILEYTGPTNLFILPGYKFKVVDAILTNFHLPQSTLIMLVSAFVGRESLLTAYETAKREGYRFYSFGDAMLII